MGVWNGISHVMSTNKDVTPICDSALPKCEFLGCLVSSRVECLCHCHTQSHSPSQVSGVRLSPWGRPLWLFQFNSVQFSHSVMSDSLRPHGPKHTRPPCPSPTPGVYPNSCPLSQWYLPTISSFVPFSSCPQSFPASGSFQMSQLFASGGQSVGVSASTSVHPMNT